MIVGIANDHHGLKLKKEIIQYLNDNNIEFVNYGCDFENNVDYIDYAYKLCKAINMKEITLGVLICGTGIGMSIVANKINGIRCAKVSTAKEAMLSKEHNMANIIALSEYTQDINNILDKFINSKYSTEERHIRRINKITEIENKYSNL